jgi:hypothetical protein
MAMFYVLNNSLQETIARQTIELTFEPFFHWTTNFKTSKISENFKISQISTKFQNFKNFIRFQNFHKISKFSKNSVFNKKRKNILKYVVT